jgi:hypothetical protein
MRGIYEISIDRYVYVGQAEVIERRQRVHLNDLRSGNHGNDFMQRAFDKYGLNLDGWFRVLELVPEDEDLTPRELFWYEARIAEQGRAMVMNLVEPGKNPMNDPIIRGRQAESMRNLAQNPEWRVKVADTNRAAAQRPERVARLSATNRAKAETDEWQALHRRTTVVAAAKANAKTYTFVSPTGERVVITNLNDFCANNGLNQGAMWSVAAGRKSVYKGWKHCEEQTDGTA